MRRTLSGYCYSSRGIHSSALDGTRARAAVAPTSVACVGPSAVCLNSDVFECPDLYAFVFYMMLWYRFIVAQGLIRGVLHGMRWWVGTRSRMFLDSFCVE